ncbi:GntR family transcriptional repressor for pyruvate dehydrogenase complex [Sphingomonas zeicaulis]|uniref:FadR/GntR family transcriptional regulator n=1 Tax=Sphingomonas zeicaulis TaxID=1632740 RepID=UPI003D1D9E2A
MRTDPSDETTAWLARPAHESNEPQGRGGTLSDMVYEKLFEWISSGHYVQESKLPSEYELAKSFEVSRPVVRDALRRLRDDGIIYSRQGAGSFVRSQADTRETASVFRPAETIADIQRCFEFRETIETATAMLAARRRNAAMIEQLETILTRLEGATASNTHREDIDFEFHLAIAAAANNQYFSTVLLGLRDQIAVGMHLHGMALLSPTGRLSESLEEHDRIVDAIRRGDGEAAAAEMRGHIKNSRDRLFGGGLLDLSL